ncbi:adaptin N terminal region-domain-containing protein [Hygrophoropsis aurantiaca]|uniref:Adaptin N terminal region-domain-containing protein n=1 Tax=Hygrophoropsis aurantiaca TaxID=72124 RepID=A0ACB8AR42_9AGAM|nr:adaptin N terminal region-domain-containing protein [Hygrophoropsis aurantiaca]
MWERTLQDLIRGLRANKNDESKFIAQAMDEIRQEIKSKDMGLKVGAVLKLTYLDMLGYDMNWASFYIVEAMSSSKIHLKSVGYLAAVQSFNEDTDVLMLTTNLLKKDLTSTPADIAVTLNGVSHIVTSDLARDLSPELIAMLNHSRPHIRKRAVLALYRVFEKYPDALRQGIGRLQEKLEDTDPGVVSATVNVLCELARRNPQDYLPLAPHLFHLLTTSSNNWMLIKIVKLFGSLSPHEPRLVKKLQPPITDLISTTSAISLLYECVHTCIIGGMLQGASGFSLARTCVSKLAAFLQDNDQNLKYIALLAMVKIVPTHPHLVAEHQDTILASVDDEDISIRMRALDLVSALVTRDNLQSVVQQVLSHLVKPETSAVPSAVQSLSQHIVPSTPAKSLTAPSQSTAYRLVLSQRIMAICSQSTYDNITDFEWYLSVLVDLAYVSGVDVGAQIRDQLVDVVGRVRGARPYAIKLMVKVLSDDTFLLHADQPGSCSEVLWAAAWICGEYCHELDGPEELLPYLLQPNVTSLSAETIAVYLNAAAKIFGYWATETAQQWTDDHLNGLKTVVDSLMEQMERFVSSPHIEVQERAANILQLFTFVQRDLTAYRPKSGSGYGVGTSSFDPVAEPDYPKSLYLLRPLFSSYELNPVASAAQASVPIPDGLDLDAWIVPSMQESILNEDADDAAERKAKRGRKGKEKEATNRSKTKTGKKKTRDDELQDVLAAPVEVETAEEKAERERLKAERLERMRDDPYYIIDDGPKKAPVDDIDSIPVVRLDDLPMPVKDGPRLPVLKSLISQSSVTRFVVEKEGEMPKNAVVTPQPSLPTSRRSTPGLFDRTATPPPLQSFQPYEVADDEAQIATPEPIKVIRAKKKGSSSTKKKRSVKPETRVEDIGSAVH